MPEEKTEIAFCPNCRQTAIRTGNEIACEKCDAVFVITEKQGAKVKKLGPIEDHEQRIKRLEGLVPDTDQTPGPKDVIDTEEEPILPE